VPWSRRMFEGELGTEIAKFWVFSLAQGWRAEREGGAAERAYAQDSCLLASQIAAYGGFWNMAGDGNITNLTVAPEYRGQGFGKFVLQFLLREMTGMRMEYASLEVRASNAAAIALYLACGFTQVGRRERYYGNGEDALLYTKKLAPA